MGIGTMILGAVIMLVGLRWFTRESENRLRTGLLCVIFIIMLAGGVLFAYSLMFMV